MSILNFTESTSSDLVYSSFKCPSAPNTIYGSHKTIYQDIQVIKLIKKAKFPVYLVQSKVTKQNYAMKVFPYKNQQPHFFYSNESRFACLRHPNVVRRLYSQEKREAELEGSHSQISYVIMEYAPRGDFLNFVRIHRKQIDEKLARTYFRQLIDGLEYIHNNGVAHMDLKLANLLIDNDGSLKMTDFDLANFEDDAIVISNGTRLYRPLEVQTGRCNSPKTADVYSAGVFMFLLKTQGVFPHFEDALVDGVDFTRLLNEEPGQFWIKHSEVQKKPIGFFDKDFQDLFISMTKFDPKDRATIKEIKESKWYNKPVYSSEELKKKISAIFSEKI